MDQRHTTDCRTTSNQYYTKFSMGQYCTFSIENTIATSKWNACAIVCSAHSFGMQWATCIHVYSFTCHKAVCRIEYVLHSTYKIQTIRAYRMFYFGHKVNSFFSFFWGGFCHNWISLPTTNMCTIYDAQTFDCFSPFFRHPMRETASTITTTDIFRGPFLLNFAPFCLCRERNVIICNIEPNITQQIIHCVRLCDNCDKAKKNRILQTEPSRTEGADKMIGLAQTMPKSKKTANF